MNRQEIVAACSARIRNGEVFLIGTRPGQRTKLTGIGGASLDFPRVYVDGMSCEISWALAERIATGQTSRVLS